jgi:iron(III) transport system substrate-binding protein
MKISKTTSRRRGRALVATGAVALAVLLAACGSDAAEGSRVEDAGGTEVETPSQSEWDEIVEKANEEGELTVFSSSGASDVHFLEFEKVYPDIDITIERQPTADLITRLEQELSVDNPAADVAYHTAAQWFLDKGEEKLLAPLQVSPEAAEIYADRDELTRYYAPIMRQPFMLAYNTESAGPVKTIEEALDAAEGGKVGLLGQSSPTATHQWMTWDENVDNFMERVSQLDYTIDASGVPLSQSLAAGEYDYVFPITPGTIDPLVEEGAPVDQVVLETHSTGIQYGLGITAASSHPNAAQVFANWLMSQKGQDFMVEKFGPAATVAGGGDSLDFDEITSFETSGRTQEEVDAWVEETWTPVME